MCMGTDQLIAQRFWMFLSLKQVQMLHQCSLRTSKEIFKKELYVLIKRQILKSELLQGKVNYTRTYTNVLTGKGKPVMSRVIKIVD